MHREKKESAFRDFILIVAGCTLLGFGVKSIFDPSGLVTGGISGLSILIKDLTSEWIPGGIPLWATTLCLNAPLFVAAFFMKGFRYIKKTLFATVFLSLVLAVLPPWGGVSDDPLLTAVFGALFCGGGMGLVFLARATTGGTDMLADLIHQKLPHYSIAQIMQVLDGMIVLAGAYVFGIHTALYAAMAIFLMAKVVDAIIDGLKFSKLAYIISDRYEAIGQAVNQELDRGATGLYGRGIYSQADKKILFCVVSKKEIVDLKELVYRYDPQAFVIVSDVREVLGEGFIQYR